MNEKTIDEADEDVLSREVSDDALETAGARRKGGLKFRPRPATSLTTSHALPNGRKWEAERGISSLPIGTSVEWHP